MNHDHPAVSAAIPQHKHSGVPTHADITVTGKVVQARRSGDAFTYNVISGDSTAGAGSTSGTSPVSGVGLSGSKDTGNATSTPSITIDVPNYSGSTGNNTATDAAQAHSILQPYLVTYIWVRTA
jgi:hypothetical protein